jgi:hypothetical protein
MSEINQKTSAEPRDSCHELEARTNTISRLDSHLLVAIEKVNHTFLLDDCPLPGTAKEKMIGLKKWRIAKLGAWQLIAAYLLCKKPYIAISTFGVSDIHDTSPLTWSL